jgi:hypothetical protein
MSEKRTCIFGEIVIVLVLGLVLVSSLSIKVVSAQAGQVTLVPTDDTYVDSSISNSNYGGQGFLRIQNYQEVILGQTYDYESVVWLKFDLSYVPSGAQVDGAALQLYTDYVSETFNVHAYSCSNNSWTELTLTYLNMPDYNTTSMDSVFVYPLHQYYNWSVVDAVRNALNSGSKTVTIVLLDPFLHSSSTEVVEFYSKEYSSGSPPKLAIHWSGIVPEFPTFLILPFFMIATLIAVVLYKKKTILDKKALVKLKKQYEKEVF